MYISHKLNSFDGGLGDKPFRPEEQDADNLRRHFLLEANASIEDSRLLGDFRRCLRPGSGRKEAFVRFCEARRALMADAFEGWTQELRSEVGVVKRVEPAALRFRPTAEDRVRELAYSDEIEDAVLHLIAAGAVQDTRGSSGLSIVLYERSPRRLVMRLELDRNFIRVRINKRDAPLAVTFVSSLAEPSGQEATDGPIKLDVGGDAAAGTAAVLLALAGALTA